MNFSCKVVPSIKGGVFCAGGDLKSFKANFQGGAQSVEDIAAASRKTGELFDLLNEMPQVVVILVEGAAMAGGLGMVCTANYTRGESKWK